MTDYESKVGSVHSAHLRDLANAATRHAAVVTAIADLEASGQMSAEQMRKMVSYADVEGQTIVNMSKQYERLTNHLRQILDGE